MVEEISDGLEVINQPAGHVEDQESFQQAVIRETLEETGWQFIPEAVTGIYRWIHPNNGHTYLRHCFTGRCTNHDPQRELDKDILRASWMSYDELISQKEKLRSPLVLKCIDDYLNGQQFPLELYTDIK